MIFVEVLWNSVFMKFEKRVIETNSSSFMKRFDKFNEINGKESDFEL